MREIEFRGKRAGTDEWVYGGICAGSDDPVYITDGIDDFIILRETIGQYTGLKDKNGAKIFEGDIIAFKDSGPSRARVFFADGMFSVFTTKGIRGLYTVRRRCEIIGNIHDTPELLEKTEEK